MGEQENPGDSIDFLVPQASINNTRSTRLSDYFGIDCSSFGALANVSALPYRMYNRVYNFHYRDQNLIESVIQPTGDGTDSNDYEILRRGKRHDYFTASLPFQQKGDPVGVSLAGTAPLVGLGAIGTSVIVEADPDEASDNYSFNVPAAPGNAQWADTGAESTLFADLTQASGITITDLRQSLAVQHVLERDARSGSRYPEILMSRFRVFDPQMLVLQRPEFLGGGTKRINVTPVPQTSSTSDSQGPVDTPQGNLAGVGTAMVDGIGFTRSFTEHGFIMGIVSARADLTYQQGLERMWSRRARFDFYHPELAHLSEQAVLQKEIYFTGNEEDDDVVWGYVGAYDDYRYGVSLVTSTFRTAAPQSLDIWHVSQYFENSPTLNQTFIEENPPIDRVIAVQDEPHLIMDCFIQDVAARPLPVNGIPGMSRI